MYHSGYGALVLDHFHCRLPLLLLHNIMLCLHLYCWPAAVSRQPGDNQHNNQQDTEHLCREMDVCRNNRGCMHWSQWRREREREWKRRHPIARTRPNKMANAATTAVYQSITYPRLEFPLPCLSALPEPSFFLLNLVNGNEWGRQGNGSAQNTQHRNICTIHTQIHDTDKRRTGRRAFSNCFVSQKRLHIYV